MKREKMNRSKAKGLAGVILFIVAFQGGMLFYKIYKDRTTNSVEHFEVERLEENRDSVKGAIYSALDQYPSGGNIRRKRSSSENSSQSVERRIVGRSVFRFDPNTVSISQLQQLGFSEKQAIAIDNYRKRGGVFHKREDFSKLFVVSDANYSRLKDSIFVTKERQEVRIELNSADSIGILSLKGIGPYYAKRIMEYRERLGGFAKIEQLLEIKGIDEERLNGFRDRISIDPSRIRRICLKTADLETLRRVPYLKEYDVKAIDLYRRSCDSLRYNDIIRDGVIGERYAEILSFYLY